MTVSPIYQYFREQRNADWSQRHLESDANTTTHNCLCELPSSTGFGAFAKLSKYIYLSKEVRDA
eukprot:scaffold593_cov66-Skeletonema_dohrnii-CCMP3373.AAC.1